MIELESPERSVAHQAFISYASEDASASAKIKKSLQERGIRCWRAPEDVVESTWADAIARALKTVKIFVLVWSSSTQRSSDVFKELALAAQNNLLVAPIRIENVRPRKRWNYHLAPTHWFNAYDPPFEQHLDRYADRVSALLKSPEDPKTVDLARQVLAILDADECPTFQGAKVILDEIRDDLVLDPDLASLRQFCFELVDFCLETGIPRTAEGDVDSWWRMFQSTNKLKLLDGLKRMGPVPLLAQALNLKKQMNDYPYWVESVSKRYLTPSAASGV